MFRNSVFKNPVGWARMVAGTRRRYFITSAVSAAAGLLVLVMMLCTLDTLWERFLIGICTVTAAIEIPLYSLRALRSLLENNEYGKTSFV